MKVRRIKLVSFMNHGETAVELPDGGVVAVTGANGSGKSAVLEAVAWAGWGKTLRGSSPVPPGGEKTIRVDMDVGDTVITRAKRAGTVRWPNMEKYGTNTKAQHGLETQIGTFDTWKRTHYFSSESSGFARATDSERKRLLEALLGIGRYEAAYRACLKDLNKAAAELKDHRHKLQLAETRMDGLLERVEDAEDALENSGLPTPDQAADVDDLRQKLVELKAQRQKLDAGVREAQRLAGEASARVRQAKQHIERLSADACPTCGQTIPEQLRDDLKGEFWEASQEAKAAQQRVETGRERARDAQKAQQAEMEQLQAGISDANAQKAAAERQRQTVERARAQVTRLEDQIADEEAHLDTLLGESYAMERRHSVLATASHVLGTKGFRAQILGDALEGLQVAANAVLDHLTGGGLRIELASYSTTAAGKVVDSISLSVSGAGGDHGYKACSTGQRRRIDVAIVLALARLAGAEGTLWFDEVFDGLDDYGVDRLTELLADLAQDRALVVITHSSALGKRIQAAERWHVEDGVVHG